MPRRSKSWSARFLISGFTRNAIVAEFVDINLLLFDNGEQYNIVCAQKQAREGDFGRVEVEKWRKAA